VARAASDTWSLATTLMALAAGDTPTAGDHFVHAMSAYRQIGDKPGVAECVVGQAAVAAAHGRSENAGRLFGMAEGRAVRFDQAIERALESGR
jgi:hypothetical protein